MQTMSRNSSGLHPTTRIVSPSWTKNPGCATCVQKRPSIRIDHNGVAHHPHIFTPHEFFQAVTVVKAGHSAGFLVGEERERQRVFANELGVGGGVVFTDAQHFDVVLFEAPPAVSEIASFLRAAWGVVFWVEIKNDPLTFERRELNRFTVLIGEREIWS